MRQVRERVSHSAVRTRSADLHCSAAGQSHPVRRQPRSAALSTGVSLMCVNWLYCTTNSRCSFSMFCSEDFESVMPITISPESDEAKPQNEAASVHSTLVLRSHPRIGPLREMLLRYLNQNTVPTPPTPSEVSANATAATSSTAPATSTAAPSTAVASSTSETAAAAAASSAAPPSAAPAFSVAAAAFNKQAPTLKGSADGTTVS